MVPHDRFTDLRRPPSAIVRSPTIEYDIMRRVREWMAGGPPPHGLPSLRQPPTARAVEDCLDATAVLMDGPPPHGLPSLRQPPTARAVEDCLDATAVLMDQSPDPPAGGATAGSRGAAP